MRVCVAPPIVIEGGSLHRGAGVRGSVLSIRSFEVPPLLGVCPWDPGLAIFEVVLGDVGMFGASWRGPGGP
jgi:hypothetical protein